MIYPKIRKKKKNITGIANADNNKIYYICLKRKTLLNKI